jgi:hypothetical protein
MWLSTDCDLRDSQSIQPARADGDALRKELSRSTLDANTIEAIMRANGVEVDIAVDGRHAEGRSDGMVVQGFAWAPQSMGAATWSMCSSTHTRGFDLVLEIIRPLPVDA